MCGGRKPDSGPERNQGKWGEETPLWVLGEGMVARRGGERGPVGAQGRSQMLAGGPGDGTGCIVKCDEMA